MTVEIDLANSLPPRPYDTRSHIHTGPLVITTKHSSLWLNPPVSHARLFTTENGLYNSISKWLTTSLTELMYRFSMYDTPPSVWGSLTSSSFSSLSSITPTPSHFLSLDLAFSVITNKPDTHYMYPFRCRFVHNKKLHKVESSLWTRLEKIISKVYRVSGNVSLSLMCFYY